MNRTTLVLLVAAGVVLAVVTAVYAVRLLLRLVRARKVLKSTGMPLSTKAMFWGSVAYLICPIDLLPDPIYLDDVGVLLLALRSVHAAALKAGAARRRS
ncbi:YkvA family protein [Streptomyces sp. NBC_01198]|uniref:YkvA family protein n=1 Tax=Streptomyces sp. NBC_01198 TaxID=2903769 RepID=UPI002E162170|nr:YkvA family protein [Streptomyces sp. NBC_01198]